jgi:hypothetical protein
MDANPDALSNTIFYIIAAGSIAFFGVVYFFVLR